ncbi:MAG: zinc ribbon domain-containing protein [Deltaproteobacteria bacterium]|nr:zinc ribbon domain-containing protein [Deltaproteobacteria bacterium]NNK85573.1 zinc ribbon domain-containing protein [Desulfobacterales bacterium]
MFIIAGVSPKIKIIDKNPRRCPVCGLHQAYFKRADQYFSLFFIPIIRINKGKPFIMCDRCEAQVNEFGQDQPGWSSKKTNKCKNCGQNLDQDFEFCPYCGKHV